MAAGQMLGQWGAWDYSGLPSSNYPTVDTRNGRQILRFNATTSVSAKYKLELPDHYSGGGVNLKVRWFASTATSGTTRWGAKAERGNTDVDTDSFDDEKTADGTPNGTSGIETVTTIALAAADLDGAAAGDTVWFDLRRIISGVTGNMSGDAELYHLSAYES